MAFEIEHNILKRYIEEDGITEIFIPDGVTEIGCQAFERCEHLTSVHLPDTVTEIGENAFAICKNLANVDLPDGLTAIKRHAFRDCESLISIHLPDSVKLIGLNAFGGCKKLTHVQLPEKINRTGIFAFSDCKKVSILIPVSENEKINISLVPEKTFSGVRLMKQIQMLRIRNFSMKMKTGVKYLLLCRFLVLCPEMPELVAYMKEHFEEILEFAIENNFIEAILIFISWNLLNQGNIDGFIQLAIDNTQKSGNPEIQLLLIEYKYKHIEFTSIEDKFKL